MTSWFFGRGRVVMVTMLVAAALLLLAAACIPAGEFDTIFVSMSAAGTTDDGVDYDVQDILAGVSNAPDPDSWYKVFDGSELGLGPTANIRAFSFDEFLWLNYFFTGDGVTADDFENLPPLYMSFSPNRVRVPGISGWVYGQDVVRFTETEVVNAVDAGEFDLFFDGSDVGLTTVQEKIDALGYFSPEYIDYFFANADVPLDCNAGIFFMSTAGPYKVKGASGANLTGQGSDILLFCGFNFGPDTAGQWYRVFRGSEVALHPGSVLMAMDVAGFFPEEVTVAAPDDLDGGIVMLFTTRKPFTAPSLVDPGVPNRIYAAATDTGVWDTTFDFNDNGFLPAINGRVDSFSLFDAPLP